MTFEKKILITALLSVVLAVPVTLALQHWSRQLKIERSQNSNLQLQLDTRAKELQQKVRQIQQDKKANDDLQKQLQTKRDETVTVDRAESVAPSGGNCESYRSLLASYNWNVNTAMAVMRAESGCNPSATSATCDHGLLQINCVHSAAVGGNLALLNDPATNVRVAYAIYAAAGGWSPWTTFTSGAYLRYL